MLPFLFTPYSVILILSVSLDFIPDAASFKKDMHVLGERPPLSAFLRFPPFCTH